MGFRMNTSRGGAQELKSLSQANSELLTHCVLFYNGCCVYNKMHHFAVPSSVSVCGGLGFGESDSSLSSHDHAFSLIYSLFKDIKERSFLLSMSANAVLDKVENAGSVVEVVSYEEALMLEQVSDNIQTVVEKTLSDNVAKVALQVSSLAFVTAEINNRFENLAKNIAPKVLSNPEKGIALQSASNLQPSSNKEAFDSDKVSPYLATKYDGENSFDDFSFFFSGQIDDVDFATEIANMTKSKIINDIEKSLLAHTDLLFSASLV